MPKISALPVGTTTTGTELVAAVQGGTTKQFAASRLGGLDYYNVKNYGAVGDGSTNDTDAIIAAITAAGVAGGGTVYFPSGTYIVRPIFSVLALGNDAAAIYIDYDNITLLGAGIYQSIVKFLLWNGDNPATDWDVAASQVVRGNAFILQGNPRSGFTCRDLQIDGSGAGNTGNNGYPANTSTGDGYDSSHQAISVLSGGTSLDNVLIENCYFHHFAGGGYASLGEHGRITIRNCRMSDGNGDAITVESTNLLVEGCEFHDYCNAGAECTYQDGVQIYRNNHIHDCDHNGLNVYPTFDTGEWGHIEIYDNQILRTAKGVFPPGAINMRIYNNLFVDNTFAVYLDNPGLGGSGTEFIISDNVEIFNNRILCDVNSPTNQSGIYLNSPTADPVGRVHIHDNIANITANGRSAGKTFMHCLEITDVSGKFGGAIGMRGNRFRGNETFASTGIRSNTENAKIVDYLVPDTSAHIIAEVYDENSYVRRIFVSYTNASAGQTITIVVGWKDTGGVDVTKTIASGAHAVGYYELNHEVQQQGYTESGYLKVTITCSVASQCAVSAEILNW